MPAYRPNSRPMNRPWQARVQHEGKRVSLGWFATKDEALEAEEAYRAENNLPDWSRRAPFNPGGRPRESAS